tara:strand:- start:529 stop:801 length:273 start_codon:yes stop_codon:yes gene_type:complete
LSISSTSLIGVFFIACAVLLSIHAKYCFTFGTLSHKNFPHFTTPASARFHPTQVATPVGVISHLLATSYLAPATAHSNAILPAFNAVFPF